MFFISELLLLTRTRTNFNNFSLYYLQLVIIIILINLHQHIETSKSSSEKKTDSNFFHRHLIWYLIINITASSTYSSTLFLVVATTKHDADVLLYYFHTNANNKKQAMLGLHGTPWVALIPRTRYYHYWIYLLCGAEFYCKMKMESHHHARSFFRLLKMVCHKIKLYS